MKNLLIILLTFLSISIQAQIDIGIIGGINLSSSISENIDITNTKGETEYGIGAVVDIGLFDNLSVQMEPMYIQKGSSLTPDETNFSDYTIIVSYIELPVILKYAYGNIFKPYVVAGGATSLKLSSEMETEVNEVKFSGNLDDVVNKIEYSLTFGGGIEFNLNSVTIFFEGRYSFSLGNQIKAGEYTIQAGQYSLTGEVEDDSSYKNKGIQIFGGVTIPLSVL
ncbi:MAG: porin family protein [Ignavibacteria bacterium]|jgi:opacity protein-like surface antigen